LARDVVYRDSPDTDLAGYPADLKAGYLISCRIFFYEFERLPFERLDIGYEKGRIIRPTRYPVHP
jgi:hypothetical protein